MDTRTNWPSLIQLVLSALAAFLLLSAATVITVIGVAPFFFQNETASDPTQSLMIATSLAFAGVLVIPSAWYAWKRIAYPDTVYTARPESRWFWLIFTTIVVIVVAGTILLGSKVSTNSRLSWFLLPPLNLIAVGLPALWLIYIGTHGLVTGSPSRRWGVFASGLVLGPLIILVIEFVAMLILAIVAIVYVMLNPKLSAQFNTLLFHLQNAGGNPDAILTNMLPFIFDPGIMVLVFSFTSLLVPLVEEALKPIGVWFLAGQKLTPAQGFGFGVLSGAGFGLFENLGNTSAGGDSWALLVSARISTLLLHSLTAGLVGWALVSVFRYKRYLRLAVVYFLAVVIHGLWNGMAVLSVFGSLQEQTNVNIPPILLQIGNLSSVGIVAMGAFNLVLFIAINTTLRHHLPTANPPPADPGAPEESDPPLLPLYPVQVAPGEEAADTPDIDPLRPPSQDKPLTDTELNP